MSDVSRKYLDNVGNATQHLRGMSLSLTQIGTSDHFRGKFTELFDFFAEECAKIAETIDPNNGCI